MTRRAFAFAALLCATIFMAGCQTTGAGTASTLSGDVTATLSWRSTSGSSGDMTATLNNGVSYSGPYFQITRETRVDDVRPLWTGWVTRYGRWQYWGPEPVGGEWPRFVTHYSGRVLANLAAGDGTHMRCRFHLEHPSSGMAGGGIGQCQLPSGRDIDAVFPRQ